MGQLTVQDFESFLPVTRGASTSETIALKIQNAFEGREFTILSAVHLPMGEAYQTPLGSIGRHGFLLEDTTTGEKVVVGRRLLLKVAELYDCVNLAELDNLPQTWLS